ncbi:YdeI/OmpD-associated family protein [Sphingomonas sp. BIUV-7]|uniref:YdeI/OmpD-associated family protein n=1 Tax=Sphingomonas natans TaxID=3063330 RepID=A0ABT8YES1_9SPHN|nr:YdeI/OmpD-associated family protein [Sphingomonas sp. BIUV-7]MDO6416853.1 YdeI/OmpD-associated family protein [Sphingomonas sp. BIUV-7]
MAKDDRVDAAIAKAGDFAKPILGRLRAALHEAEPGLVETIKWGRPFFELDGRPFAFMAAFKAHCGFGFWQGAETGREEEGAGQYGRIASLADLPPDAELVALIRARAAEARLERPSRPRRIAKGEAALPDDLASALAADPQAAAHFAGFAPGQRRDYIDWVTEAKRPETRARRIGETVAQVAQGLRRNEKYRSC